MSLQFSCTHQIEGNLCTLDHASIWWHLKCKCFWQQYARIRETQNNYRTLMGCLATLFYFCVCDVVMADSLQQCLTSAPVHAEEPSNASNFESCEEGLDTPATATPHRCECTWDDEFNTRHIESRSCWVIRRWKILAPAFQTGFYILNALLPISVM
jgi:hypothetical protein